MKFQNNTHTLGRRCLSTLWLMRGQHVGAEGQDPFLEGPTATPSVFLEPVHGPHVGVTEPSLPPAWRSRPSSSLCLCSCPVWPGRFSWPEGQALTLPACWHHPLHVDRPRRPLQAALLVCTSHPPRHLP